MLCYENQSIIVPVVMLSCIEAFLYLAWLIMCENDNSLNVAHINKHNWPTLTIAVENYSQPLQHEATIIYFDLVVGTLCLSLML